MALDSDWNYTFFYFFDSNYCAQSSLRYLRRGERVCHCAGETLGLNPGFWSLADPRLARKQSRLTQEEVASHMVTTKSAVSRREASLRSDKGSPWFAAPRKHAHCSPKVRIKLAPVLALRPF